jgi:hypothetical protein
MALEARLDEVNEQRRGILDLDSACELLSTLPDLRAVLEDAPAELLREIFDAFNLMIDIDRGAGTATVHVFISSALARAEAAEDLTNAAALKERQRVSKPDIAGAGFGPATSGL